MTLSTLNSIQALDHLEPFTVAVSDDQLADLKARLRATRWPDDVGNEDWFYGVNGAYLRRLADYWPNGFDWRRVERQINGYANYRVVIDGVPVHFLYKAGRGGAPIPIILSHGWPWTFWDWSKVIDPLADPVAFGGDPAEAFDVLVTSLPGFGFSTPLPHPDMNFWKIADVCHRLMTETLGLCRYAAGGSDMGALVTGHLGHKYADSLYGIYLARGLRLDFFFGGAPLGRDRRADGAGGRLG
jgi:microsomal epoxide hydrolase